MSLIKTAVSISKEYRHIGNVRVPDKQSKIYYEQLKDCQNIIRAGDEPITSEGEKLLSKIERFIEESRFDSSRDFAFELILALIENDSNEASLIRNKYFPAPEHGAHKDV